VAPFSHHGPIDRVHENDVDRSTRAEAFGADVPDLASQLIAREVISHYLSWSGIGRIKCIAIDLDRTLWPWILGEESHIDEGAFFQTYRYGFFGGLHQALKILKQRGVILFSCSKNNEADAMGFWRRLQAMADSSGIDYFLSPEEFVLHRINWERKSSNIASACHELGLATSGVLFVDDSAVEREEVRSSLPGIRVLGEQFQHLRMQLLLHPCLATSSTTTEARSRTELVRAQLERERFRAEVADEAAFLQQLQIKMQLDKLQDIERVDRVVELIQRTTQFNTTQRTYDAEVVRQTISDGHKSFFVAEVADRFTHYGLVAVCILDESAKLIENLVISCRVLALQIAVPFVSSVLRQCMSDARGTRAQLRQTERNAPCHEIYLQCGFRRSPDQNGWFALEDDAELTAPDPTIYNIAWRTARDRSG
jgi:FkbH-like protein